MFHRCFHEIFSDIEGVEVYLDDIIVYARNETEHNDRLDKVLKRAYERGVKFNHSKCKIGEKEVKYMGHIFSGTEIRPDPDKVAAIVSMKSPNNHKELETFLGMLTYLVRYIPKLSQKTICLRHLLKKNTDWIWDQNTENTFIELKNILITAPILQYFDTKKHVTLSVDASQSGLGAVILQDNLPIEYA